MEMSSNYDIVNQINERREKLTEKYSEIKVANEEFIKGTNHPDGAFHDFRHFLNVSEAARQLLNAAQGDKKNLPNDPAHFWESLESFCKDNNFAMPDRNDKELEIVMELFGMTHDLGNSFSKVEVLNNKLVFTSIKGKDGKNQFSKEDAEKRSLDMTDAVVDHYLKDQNLSDEKKVFITKLVKALTAETTFSANDKAKPFAIFARIADQIGQALVDEKPEDYTSRQRQLLNEEHNDPEGFKGIDAKNFGNFISKQLAFITSNDIKTQQEVLKIFTDGTNIPQYLIYKDDDPRLKELKLHPLSLRPLLYSLLDQHYILEESLKKGDPHYIPAPADKVARGYLHQLLSEIEISNGKEKSPLEQEILDVLQNPGTYGIKRKDIPRNPDIITIEFDKLTGKIIINRAYEAKTYTRLKMRDIRQLSSGGTTKGIKYLCELINRTSPNELRRKGLSVVAEMKNGHVFEIANNFEIQVVVPFDQPDLSISDNAVPTEPGDEEAIAELKSKINTKIRTRKVSHTNGKLEKLSKELTANYKPPTPVRRR